MPAGKRRRRSARREDRPGKRATRRPWPAPCPSPPEPTSGPDGPRARAVAGHHLSSEPCLLDTAEEREPPGITRVGEHGHGSQLGQGLDHEDARKDRVAGEVAGEEVLVAGQLPSSGCRLAGDERPDLRDEEERRPVGQVVLSAHAAEVTGRPTDGSRPAVLHGTDSVHRQGGRRGSDSGSRRPTHSSARRRAASSETRTNRRVSPCAST